MIDENILLHNELFTALQEQAQLNQPMNLNQIASLLKNQKWDSLAQLSFRKIAQNLNQSSNITPSSFINQYINAIIANQDQQKGQSSLVQTLRHELIQLQQKCNQIPDYPTAFIEFEKVTCQFQPDNLNLYYKIEPSTSRGATLLQISDKVTRINESYTVNLPDKVFKVSFYRTGTLIGEWEFNSQSMPQNQQINQQVYLDGRIVVSVKVKYINKKQEAIEYINMVKDKINQHQQVLNQLTSQGYNLLNFKQYFFKQPKPAPIGISELLPRKIKKYDCTNNYVKNCYYILQLQILCGCLASFCLPLSFISILVPLYLILKIHDITQNVKFVFGMSLLCQALFMVYTILSLFIGVKVNEHEKPFVYLNLIMDIGSMLMIGLVIINAEEFKEQAEQLIVRKR